jgi:hypothetical protein
MSDYLSPEDLKALLDWPTPAISNAIELFNIRPRNEGFMLSEIHCRYPRMKPMIGYAVTGIISADSPEGHKISPLDIASDVAKAAQMMEDWERNVINFCKSDQFSMEGLKERYLSPRPTWPPK